MPPYIYQTGTIILWCHAATTNWDEPMAADRIQQIATETEQERAEYLAEVGWDDNPFARELTMDEYVIPSEGDIADITSHLHDYTGPITIHSEYSGIGKTTLLDMILESVDEAAFTTVKLGEHNATAYEVAGIIADRIGVGKSSSTKLTEEKIERFARENDTELVVGIDEFGLNDPDALHTIQYINDLPGTRVILTGMSSQREATKQSGSDGAAFLRRESYDTKLEPFTPDQTREMIERRIAGVTGHTYDGNGSVPTEPITEPAIEVVHEQSRGVPAVATAALSSLVSIGAWQYRTEGIVEIDKALAQSIDYADPHADIHEHGREN